MRALALAVLLVLVAAVPTGASTLRWRGSGMHLQHVPDEVTAGEVRRLAELGATSVRIDVGWAAMEPEPGAWDEAYLAEVERAVDAAARVGVKPLLMLFETPCWASSDPGAPGNCAGARVYESASKFFPRDPAGYGAAARVLAERFRGQLAGIEVWNEPQGPFAHPDPASPLSAPQQLAALTAAAWHAVREGPDPPVVPIAAGALMGTDVPWARELLAALRDLGHPWDAFSVHPYSAPRPPSDGCDPADCQWSFTGGLPLVRAAMVEAGAAAKRLWITEVGWTTCEGNGRCSAEVAQAAHLRAAVRIASTLPYVEGLWTYELRDSTVNGADTEGDFGVLRSDLSPKPAFGELRRAFAAAAPRPGDPLRVPGLVAHLPLDGRGDLLLGTPVTAAGGGARRGCDGALTLEGAPLDLGDPALPAFTISAAVAPRGEGELAGWGALRVSTDGERLVARLGAAGVRGRLREGAWQHVAVSRALDGRLELAVGGRVVATAEDAPPPGPGPLLVGDGLHGALDELALHDRPLLPMELAAASVAARSAGLPTRPCWAGRATLPGAAR